jgi:PrgI family protein
MTPTTAATSTGETVVVRIPADLDRDDRILLGLSARQLAILIAGGLAAWILAGLLDRLLGFWVAAALAAPVGLAGVALALGWRDGLSLDRLAVAAVGWWRRPKRLVVAPDGIPGAPGWAGPPGPRVAALDGPVHGVAPWGMVDLAGEGWALVCRATPVNLVLRTPTEQQQLLAGFARLLHALTTPMQVLVRTQRADLAPLASRLRGQAAGLAHPALEQAALAHAGWLEELAAGHEVRRRELLVIFHQPPGAPDPATSLTRQAEQAAGLLAAAGVTLTPLDADGTPPACWPPPPTLTARHAPTG